MKLLGISSKNPMNDGYLYSCILHSDSIRELWEKKEPSPGKIENYRIWSYAPGEDGYKWDEFRDSGIMAIEWDEMGDLREYTSKESIKKKLDQLYGEKNDRKNDTLALWQFCNEIKIGDRIYSKAGSKKLLGIGEVISEYEFDDTRDGYKHIRKVKWLKSGSWELDEKFAIKTLTDITIYEEFCEKVEQLVFGSGAKSGSNAQFQKWFIPLVDALKEMDGRGTPDEACNAIAKNLDLSEEFVNKKGGKSNQNIFKNQVAWARNYLRYEGYIDGSEKGIWKLTEKGFDSNLTPEQVNEMVKKWVKILQEKRQGKNIEDDNPETFEDIDDKEEIGMLIAYSKDKFLSEVFLKEEQYDEFVSLLKNKKNIILQGAPGVGKTFAAKRLAYSLVESKDDSRIEMVQFHQSYSYEDFVMGYRPKKDGGFELVKGIFYRFCEKASKDPDRDYYFVIDEINRGNLSKIFGELLMLIESDKRGPEFAVPLTYDPDNRFYVPEKLHIIGMMNTADRSLAMIDYALRRRFCFVEIEPAFNSDAFRNHLENSGIEAEVINKIIGRLTYLNTKISEDSNLGRGFRIGHSFFCNPTMEQNWYANVIKYEINPLIEEYWFDNEEKSKEYKNYMLG